MSQSKKWKGLICTVQLKGLGHCISSFFSLVGSWCSCLSCNWLRFEPLQTNENPPELIQTVWSFAFNHFNLLFQDLSVRFWFMICCLLVLLVAFSFSHPLFYFFGFTLVWENVHWRATVLHWYHYFLLIFLEMVKRWVTCLQLVVFLF